MIPPDYTALETEARERAAQAETVSEEMGYQRLADALALAASLQEEKDELAGYLSHARETGHQMADAIAQLKAEKVALQDEIERLKEENKASADDLFALRLFAGEKVVAEAGAHVAKMRLAEKAHAR